MGCFILLCKDIGIPEELLIERFVKLTYDDMLTDKAFILGKEWLQKVKINKGYKLLLKSKR